jgi:hypothetical protein
MNQYIHHIPGRVNIKNSTFKNNIDELDQLIKTFEKIVGIDYITTNPFSGTMVIHYNESVIDLERFNQILLPHIRQMPPGK